MAGILRGADQLIADRPLVSFRAGKMTREINTVTADPRRGRLELVVSPEDSLTHLQWRARGSPLGHPEEDLIIFAGEADFVRVNSSPDRVFVLKWRGADTRMFFWMQDADPSTDQANVDAINNRLSDGAAMDGPPADGSAQVS
jgi:26S proteasome regulatory subunit N13